ncbi:MAG: FeeC [uncultured bacterium]|uniref:RND family efflux transporter MFP subunit n=1 Tax=Candidatus Wolfebacteria bacterium GW2011_GWE2_44_13 TaxID=1619017 RepID=A0A0G1HBF9_9BACT|nr:MAG: FeeC [uncultured bacterium]KKT43868.1 MAG: RND family efflux transporter MFP subunit [Candidatus Wolfebacteria bacterium GW2011_GWE2_44_13]
MIQTVLHFLKNKIVIAIILIILAIVGYTSYQNSRPQTYPTIPVVRGDIKEEVSITGKVKPSQNLDIAFEKGGRVSRIRVAVGDTVGQGQEMMQLDNADLYAQLAQARANVRSQEAKLAQLREGARAEDIAISQARVENAKNTLADAQRNAINVTEKATTDLANIHSSVPDTLTDAYTKSDDAIRNQIDGLFLNDETDRPTLSFSSFNSQAKINSESGRVQATDNLAAFSKNVTAARNANGDATVLNSTLENAKVNLDVFLAFFGNLQDVVNSPSGLDTTTLNTYKTAVSTARSSIVTALTNVNKQRQSIASQKSINQSAISNAQASITTAQSTLDQAERELTLKTAAASVQDVAYQESQVENARANADYYQAQIEKTILKAPFAGTITKIVPTLGDIISPNTPVVSIIGSGRFLIESYVAEADIAKVKIGNEARVTLDAYGSDALFNAKVILIDLSATTIEGVATYKTTFEFTQEDSRILSGLTANIDVLSGERTNILYIPTRNIISREGKKYVKVLTNKETGTVQEIEVVTGLRGSDGRTEILSGVAEGDAIVTN